MATMTRRITRDKLARVFKDGDGRPNLEMIKAFEYLLEDVGYLLPDEVQAVRTSTESLALAPALHASAAPPGQALQDGTAGAQIAALREEVAALRAEVRALQITPI